MTDGMWSFFILVLGKKSCLVISRMNVENRKSLCIAGLISWNAPQLLIGYVYKSDTFVVDSFNCVDRDVVDEQIHMLNSKLLPCGLSVVGTSLFDKPMDIPNMRMSPFGYPLAPGYVVTVTPRTSLHFFVRLSRGWGPFLIEEETNAVISLEDDELLLHFRCGARYSTIGASSKDVLDIPCCLVADTVTGKHFCTMLESFLSRIEEGSHALIVEVPGIQRARTLVWYSSLPVSWNNLCHDVEDGVGAVITRSNVVNSFLLQAKEVPIDAVKASEQLRVLLCLAFGFVLLAFGMAWAGFQA
jgi:hypothetical protein